MNTLYKFNKELYSKEDLMKTSYRFIDDFYIHLDVDDQYYYVTIQSKEDKKLKKEEFMNEMLVQQTRNIINKETRNIREMIYARAMASTLIQEEQVDVEEVINSIDKYVDSNRKLITYGSIPLFSYLLDMSPFFDGFNGWIEMEQLSVESMKNSLENTKEYPLIIISNVGTNNSIWPDNQTKIIMDEIKKSDVKYELINNYICENNYERVFENDSFTVYAK